jgi:hypothetical protein
MTSQFKLSLLALCALCALAPARAEQPASMVVVRDATTGQLRAPTAAELQALNAQRLTAPATGPLSGMPAGTRPIVTTGPDGTMRANVGRDSLMYAVIQRDADGKLHSQCVSGQHNAATAMSRAVPALANATKEHDHDKQ